MHHFKITDVVADMSNEEYHSFGKEIISSSYLKGIYKHSMKKAGIPLSPSDALTFGSQFHDIMELGLFEFEKKYSTVPEECSNKRTKAYKEFIAEHENVISDDDYNRIITMYNNVTQNKFLKYHEENYQSRREYSYFATCNTREYRIRPDISYHNNDQIVSVFDYKTCQDVTQFKWDLNKYAYDLQAVFYSDVLGIDPSNFYFVAIEKYYPFSVQIFGLSEQTVDRGRDRLDTAISKLESGEEGIGYETVERI